MTLARPDGTQAPIQPLDVIAPALPRAPVIYASPHSGDHYTAEFLATSRLDHLTLRGSEDCFVDEIFAAAPELGAPLLRALFPRVVLDPNREPYELDPAMFEDELPPHVNSGSLRVARGLGTIARVAGNGSEIYRDKLRFAEAERRLASYYKPYHEALAGLISETRERFGCAVLIDCHSMPSQRRARGEEASGRRTDIVLGDRFGTACAKVVVEVARKLLTSLGYRVARNAPYAGGFNTQTYGRPHEGVHALQIEINRALYMDEERIERRPAMATVSQHMTALMAALNGVDADALLPPR